MTNLSEIRARRNKAVARMWRKNEPDDSPYNQFLRAEMDRNWLLYEIDELVEDLAAALNRHPHCDKYSDDEPITCGWKLAVADIQEVVDRARTH